MDIRSLLIYKSSPPGKRKQGENSIVETSEPNKPDSSPEDQREQFSPFEGPLGKGGNVL